MTMKYRILLCSLFCLCAVTVLRAERVDMLKAGAKVDGKTLNTKLINSTIDRLNANGGGTLFFPAGTYLTSLWSWRREPLCCFLIASMIIFPLWRCVMRE